MTDRTDSIEVGARVRSHDFPDRINDNDSDRTACYVEGVVLELTDPTTDERFTDCAHYAILVERQVFGGRELTGPESLVGQTVYPPVNGTPTWLGGVTCGVVRVPHEPQRELELPSQRGERVFVCDNQMRPAAPKRKRLRVNQPVVHAVKYALGNAKLERCGCDPKAQDAMRSWLTERCVEPLEAALKLITGGPRLRMNKQALAWLQAALAGGQRKGWGGRDDCPASRKAQEEMRLYLGTWVVAPLEAAIECIEGRLDTWELAQVWGRPR